MKKNKVLQKLRNDEVVCVTNVGVFPSPLMVEVLGNIGFDCMWFDMEHRNFGLTELAQMTMAARATKMESMARVVKGNNVRITKTLEAGATELMIPHCIDAEEVRQYVSWAKYPPQGTRGFDCARPDANYAMADVKEYIKTANKETFVVIQIEDAEAVENVYEIAAVDGVDVLFLGPADLSLSCGIPFQFEHALIKKALEKVAKAAADNNKWCGTMMGSVKHGWQLVEQGAKFLIHGGDLLAIIDGFKGYRENFTQVLQG